MLHRSRQSLSAPAQCRHGFTLIELSIVLVIIGLVIGGVFVGRDLIEAANMRALITQMEKYKTAVNVFRVKYGSLPGDISQEKAQSFGFTGHTNSFTSPSGNEDGFIDRCDETAGAWMGCENVLFWRDLSDANLIEGSFATAADDWVTSLDAATLPVYFPRSRGVNGYVLVVNYLTAGPGAWTGAEPRTNNFHFTGITAIAADGNATRTNPITPIMAYGIDRKLDDGISYEGIVRSWSIRATASNFFRPATFGPGGYPPDDPSLPIPNCLIDYIQYQYNLRPAQGNQPLCTISTRF